MTELEKFVAFEPEKTPDDDKITAIKSIFELDNYFETVHESKLLGYIQKRFEYILNETYNAATKHNDDVCIEIVGRYLWDDPLADEAKKAVVSVCMKQINGQLNHRTFEMQINTQDMEDLRQETCVIICTNIRNYDSSKNQFSAFITAEVNKVIFEMKNRYGMGAGVSTTRYGASMKKHAIKALNALTEAGIKNPSSSQIAQWINSSGGLKTEVSSKVVENALGTMSIQVEMDEKIPDSYETPETSAIKAAEREHMYNMCTSPVLTKECQCLMTIYCKYYLEDGNSKNLSLESIKEIMSRMLERDVSSDQIQTYKEMLGRHLAKSGWYSGLNFKKKGRIPIKIVDSFVADDRRADEIERDILNSEDLILNML